jgi:hypothetical protein
MPQSMQIFSRKCLSGLSRFAKKINRSYLPSKIEKKIQFLQKHDTLEKLLNGTRWIETSCKVKNKTANQELNGDVTLDD